MSTGVDPSVQIPLGIGDQSLRDVPPSKQLQLLLLSPRSEAELRVFVQGQLRETLLLLGRQDWSWSVGSLNVMAGVSDRFAQLAHSVGVAEDSSGSGDSPFSAEIVRARELRKAARKDLNDRRRRAAAAVRGEKS